MADLRIDGTTGGLTGLGAARPAISPRSAGGFGETLGRLMDDVNRAQLGAESAAVALASGRSVDTTQALVTIEKANVSFQFALQIRNKLLEAYQELMRMQV